jgi:hypothetical protein
VTAQGDDPLDLLVRANDLEGLVRLVDTWCGDARWDDLGRLRERCRREAGDSGRQLWPAAALAEYRLALLAPAPWSAAMVLDASGRFVAGPLTEVAAARHSWAELAPHLGSGPAAAFVAHERVLRGEDLRDAAVDPTVLELPLTLLPWEPSYALAEYGEHAVAFPSPPATGRGTPIRLPAAPARVDDPDSEHALRELAGGWLTGSEASLRIAVVEGDEAAAVAALLAGSPANAGTEVATEEVEVLASAVSPRVLLSWLAWVGATGGAHGRRRGAATGRFAAWWAVAALTGVAWPELPADRAAAQRAVEDLGHELGEAVAELEGWWWRPAGEAADGWAVRLAVRDPVDGLAWAMQLVDH